LRFLVQNLGAKDIDDLRRYARISTDGQSVAAQVAALRKRGAGKVFRETASGAKTDRRQLRRMLGKLAPGHVVTVTRIDRLARSTFDLFGIVKRIVDVKAQVSILGRAVGRQHQQHRALNAGGTRRAGRC
jgi:DNA invertase Pin-like site-specific DNA recombinase